jgi:histidine triad (HIT) family protein
MREEACPFCRVLRGELPASEVYSDERIFAFDDIAPQAPVHILIIPRDHISTLNELHEKDEQLMGHIVRVAAEIAKQKGLSGSGYRLVCNCQWQAGQSIFHVHFHLLGGRSMRWPPG